MRKAFSEASLPNDSQVEQEVLDGEPRNIILGIIAQLAKGTELSRVSLPTFVLEPRSFCERFVDFMSHPQLLLEYAFSFLRPSLPEQRRTNAHNLMGWSYWITF